MSDPDHGGAPELPDNRLPEDDPDPGTPESKADALAGDWIDERANRELAQDDGVARSRLADQLLLDALLHEVSHPQAEAHAARVDGVLAAIDSSTETPATLDDDLPETLAFPETIALESHARRTRRRLLGGLAGVAAMLLAALLLWSGPRMRTAEAAVLEASQIALEPTDRQYRITARGDLQAKLPLPIAIETQAMLFVRGEWFAVRFRNPLGAEVWSGCQGDACWLVPAVGPVLVGERLETLSQRLLGSDDRSNAGGERLPVLHLARILRRLPEQYELSWLPDEPRGPGGPICRRIVGRRRVMSELWPERIDLWIATGSGVVERALLNWQAANERVVASLDVELTGREPQADAWYSHNAHHQPGRPVLELPPVELP